MSRTESASQTSSTILDELLPMGADRTRTDTRRDRPFLIQDSSGRAFRHSLFAPAPITTHETFGGPLHDPGGLLSSDDVPLEPEMELSPYAVGAIGYHLASRSVMQRLSKLVVHALGGAGLAAPQEEVSAATDHITITLAIERLGRVRAARRIIELSQLHDDDPDKPQINLDSLKRAALLMLDNSQWGEPSLTLSDEGYVHAAWPTKEGGRVSITFLPNGRVDYSAILERPGSDERIVNIGGHHYEKQAIENLRWFSPHIDPSATR